MTSAEALYAKLRELADNEPEFSLPSAELARWLGRLHHVLVEVGAGTDISMLKVAGDALSAFWLSRRPMLSETFFIGLSPRWSTGFRR